MTRSRMLGGALTCILAAAIIAALLAVGGAAGAATPTPVQKVAYKTVPAVWVLSTVSDGSYKDAVAAYERLRQFRDDRDLEAADDTGTFVYLSDPTADPSSQHIEIQLPVTSAAAKSIEASVREIAPRYNLGTTAVKQLPERFVASLTKSAGVTDPKTSWEQLYRQVATDGFSSLQAPRETFENISAIPATCTYDELETSISLVLE